MSTLLRSHTFRVTVALCVLAGRATERPTPTLAVTPASTTTSSATERPRQVLPEGEAATALAFWPDARTLAVGSIDDSVRLWDFSTGRLRRAVGVSGGSHTWGPVVFSPDRRLLANAGVNTSDANDVLLWDSLTGKLRWRMVTSSSEVTALAFSGDGRMLASAGREDGIEGMVRLWNTRTGKLTRRLRGRYGDVLAVGFSPDGRRLASVSADGSLQLRDARTGRRIRRQRLPVEAVSIAAFAPDARRVATACFEDRSGTVTIWNAVIGRSERVLRGLNQRPRSLAFSPDGRLIGSGGQQAAIAVWDVQTGRLRRRLHIHGGKVVCLAISPDGAWLATASSEGPVALWDLFRLGVTPARSHSVPPRTVQRSNYPGDV